MHATFSRGDFLPIMMYYRWKIPQSMALILQFPDSTTAIMPSPAASPRFHVDAVRMGSYSCDAVAFAWLILHGRVGLGIRQLSY